MIKTGKLIKWDKKKGFGFIQFDNQDRQIFVHISAFPRKSGKPKLNESLAFQIGTGKDGKPAAVAIQLVDRKMPPQEDLSRRRNNWRFGRLVALIIWGLLIVGGFYAYKYMWPTIQDWAHQKELSNTQGNHQLEIIQPQNNYQCGGRVYCSQMTSCNEATWVLRNCPNTKMDGNDDGVPCEKQWCR